MEACEGMEYGDENQPMVDKAWLNCLRAYKRIGLNAQTERYFGTVARDARALLAQAGLPDSYADSAFLHSERVAVADEECLAEGLGHDVGDIVEARDKEELDDAVLDQARRPLTLSLARIASTLARSCCLSSEPQERRRVGRSLVQSLASLRRRLARSRCLSCEPQGRVGRSIPQGRVGRSLVHSLASHRRRLARSCCLSSEPQRRVGHSLSWRARSCCLSYEPQGFAGRSLVNLALVNLLASRRNCCLLHKTKTRSLVHS
ncbi:hypothetical protein T492DRAFT_865979 [Pavlovales sp. CCMP2436]|nr:hypothetical protein T492DRAFT_865979 [Pavlovales sp. CCMP2436]